MPAFMNAPSGLPEKREPSGEAVDDRKNTHMPVKILAAIILVLGLTGTLMAQERIQISSEWGEMTAELADNDAARSLLRMLPVIIQMRDHLRQEKTGNLPSPLKEVARQTHFSKGTLGLWNSDHFVIYYRDGQVPEPGIIILGQAVGNASIFDRPGPVTVHIERAQ